MEKYNPYRVVVIVVVVATATREDVVICLNITFILRMAKIMAHF